jgi:FixJ family two-component response regulator
MSGRVTILVVEDDASMRRGLGRLLRAGGYDCLEFESGEALLKSGEASRGACVVADIHLPNMTGFDLVARLRERHGRMPAIFITASDTPDIRQRALSCRDAAFLVKPFEGVALLEAVRKGAASRPTGC